MDGYTNICADSSFYAISANAITMFLVIRRLHPEGYAGEHSWGCVNGVCMRNLYQFTSSALLQLAASQLLKRAGVAGNQCTLATVVFFFTKHNYWYVVKDLQTTIDYKVGEQSINYWWTQLTSPSHLWWSLPHATFRLAVECFYLVSHYYGCFS